MPPAGMPNGAAWPANVVPRTSSIAQRLSRPHRHAHLRRGPVVARRREGPVDRALGEVGQVDVRGPGEGVRDPQGADELLSAATRGLRRGEDPLRRRGGVGGRRASQEEEGEAGEGEASHRGAPFRGTAGILAPAMRGSVAGGIRMPGRCGKRAMEKKGVGRPRDGNPEETRREILRAAGEAFAACGFVGATTRAVAARAGVNVATLHYHFGSKEGLYRAVLENASRGTLPAVPSGPGGETVARLVEGLFAVRLRASDPRAPRSPRHARGPGAQGRDALRPEGPLARRSARSDPRAVERAPGPGARGDRALRRRARRRHLPRRRSPAVGRRDPTGTARPAPAPPPLPNEAARGAVVAAALRLSGLG